MRTYSRADFLRSRQEWADFGREWEWLRKLAINGGMLFPPSGTKHDDRDVPEPSQRAIVYRALVDNPTELRRIVLRSKSWSQVVDGIFGLETRLRGDADDTQRDADWERERRASHRQSVMSLAAILQRIEDSR